jgi:small subunit ribosomal protein S17
MKGFSNEKVTKDLTNMKTIKCLEGKIVSNKKFKEGTFTVEVVNKKTHPLYKKVISSKKKYIVDGKRDFIEIGTFVRIKQCRPLSKLKRYEIISEGESNVN